MEEKSKVKFKDLSLFLKVAAIFGFIEGSLMLLAMLIGFIEGIIGV